MDECFNLEEMVEKEVLWRTVESVLRNRLTEIQLQQSMLQQDLLSETKSTAGDKYETGRAMVHLELEKMANQQRILEQSIRQLERLKMNETQMKIFPGSWVLVNGDWFLVGLGLGKIDFEGRTVFGISTEAPLGKVLNGKMKNDRFEFQGKSMHIEDVL